MLRQRLTFGLLLAATAVALAVPVAAQAATSLSVSPTTTAPGTTVHVSGSCGHQTSGFVISPAFLHDSSHDFAGVGAVSFSTGAGGGFSVDAAVPASIRPGSYTVSARCGGGNLGITATLIVSGTLPTHVPAGSGGAAATPGAPADAWWLGVAGLALVAAGGGLLGRRAIRRSRA
ncbi:MAG: hypothetical protein ACXV1K_11775 [Kineosporiaceae bacterium]